MTYEAQIHIEDAVSNELQAALALHGEFASAHEAYAVLLEEVEEVWLEVKKKRSERDPVKLYRELAQVAAMAEKWMLQLERELPAMATIEIKEAGR